MIEKRLCPGCRQFYTLGEKFFRKHGQGAFSSRCRTCASRRDRIKRLRYKLAGALPKIVPLATLERSAIERAAVLTACPVKAAKLLGISKATIYRRLRAYAKLPPLKRGRGVRYPTEVRAELAKAMELEEQVRQEAKAAALALLGSHAADR